MTNFLNCINIQLRLAWESSQTKETLEILKLSSGNLINRLGITALFLLMIYILSNLDIYNQNFSNLRWALIGTFASAIATIVFLDAYNKYSKLKIFGKVCGHKIYNIFFRLNIIVQTIAIAFISDYYLGYKKFSPTSSLNKKFILDIKEELNKSENILTIKRNNICFVVLPRCYKSINDDILRIIDILIPETLLYADNKDFIESLTLLEDSLESFINILRLESDAIELWYPNNMAMAPESLGNADRLINSVNILLNNILLFLENNENLVEILENTSNY